MASRARQLLATPHLGTTWRATAPKGRHPTDGQTPPSVTNASDRYSLRFPLLSCATTANPLDSSAA